MKTESYEEFIKKFENKKTTDDCYTPADVYNVVCNYFCKKLSIDRSKIIRPFYPGGDYQNENYRDKIVLDNPPFSKMAEIERFYAANGVPFVLFAPGLTAMTRTSLNAKLGIVYLQYGIRYENGANVMTAFVSNLFNKIILDPVLGDEIHKVQLKPVKRSKHLKDEYTNADLITVCRHVQQPVKLDYSNFSISNNKETFGTSIIIPGGVPHE